VVVCVCEVQDVLSLRIGGSLPPLSPSLQAGRRFLPSRPGRQILPGGFQVRTEGWRVAGEKRKEIPRVFLLLGPISAFPSGVVSLPGRGRSPEVEAGLPLDSSLKRFLHQGSPCRGLCLVVLLPFFAHSLPDLVGFGTPDISLFIPAFCLYGLEFPSQNHI